MFVFILYYKHRFPHVDAFEREMPLNMCVCSFIQLYVHDISIDNLVKFFC